MIFAPTTLVISRRSDVERRARFRAQADAIGLESWAFFDAIDAPVMGLTTSNPSRHGRAGRPAPTPLCPGEIGCALSHLAIIRTCLALGIRAACVMEDDVEFVEPDSFPSAWGDFVRACPSDWLLVHAGGDDFYAETAPLPISDLVARVRLTYGTRFMVMKTEAMQLLSDAGAAMEEPADWLLEPLFATGRVYYPRRALMRHSDGPSGIVPEGLDADTRDNDGRELHRALHLLPQDTLKAAYPKDTAHRLSLDDFRTVLSKIPPYVRIDFSGFVEPWLNPDCTEMLRETLRRRYSVAIYTTLQGMREPQKVTGLLIQHAPQIEVMCLHLPDANGNMTGHRDDPEWREALRCFLALRSSRELVRFETMTMDAAGTPAPLIPVEQLRPWTGTDRAASLPRGQVAGQALEHRVAHDGAVTCSYTPFYDQNVLLPNGDVVLCCNDYQLRHPLGNLLRQEYRELFTGETMMRLHAANMTPGRRYDERGRTICKDCSRATNHTTSAGGGLSARQMWRPT